MDGAWLQLPPVEWTRDADYQQMSAILSDLAVVNDAAERCVRDIQEYANAANDGNQRGNIILVSGFPHSSRMRWRKIYSLICDQSSYLIDHVFHVQSHMFYVSVLMLISDMQ